MALQPGLAKTPVTDDNGIMRREWLLFFQQLALGAGGAVRLETNGVNNGSQVILDLKNGSNITITDDGLGGITINSAAGGGSVTSVTGTLPITSSGGATPNLAVNLATATDVGVVKPDNTTITVTAGVLSAVGGGSVTDVTATAPLSSSGGATPNISESQADTGTDGYLSSTDWNTFNNKPNLPIAESDVTNLVTDLAAKVAANVAITPGTNPKITYDAKGLVTAGSALVAGDIPNIAESQVTNLVADLAAKVPTSRTLTAGTGLTGGGDLSGDRSFAASANLLAEGVGIVIDGSGSVPSTGSKGFRQVPYGCTITGWTILLDAAGACQITVKKSTYTGFPTTASIVAALPPNVAATNQKNTSTTLTGWTLSIAAGDVLEFNLDSVTTATRIFLILNVTRT